MEFKVPEEMLRRGRPENQNFSNGEQLYRRVHPEQFVPNLGPVPIYAVDLPNTSVNRETPHGIPEFVLYDVVNQVHRKGWGIVALLCEDIPFQDGFEAVGENSGRTVVEHVPLKENYYHSEIRVKDSGDEEVSLPYSAIQQYRVRVRANLRVIKKPE